MGSGFRVLYGMVNLDKNGFIITHLLDYQNGNPSPASALFES